jgi:hypothetical protein
VSCGWRVLGVKHGKGAESQHTKARRLVRVHNAVQA